MSPARASNPATDGEMGTKWAIEHGGKPVVWQIAATAAHRVSAYSLTSGNDVPARDPQTWEFDGSNDGENWAVLDKHQREAPFAQRGQTKTYQFPNDNAYRFYRFVFQPSADDPFFQVAEIALDGLKIPSTNNLGNATDYRRELDVQHAIARTSFTLDGVHHVREVFASHPAQVLVMRWSADKAAAISGVIGLQGAHGETSLTRGNTLEFSGTLNNGLRYGTLARVIARGGSVRVVGDALQLDKCDDAVILLASGTDYAMDYAHDYRGAMQPLQQQIDAAAKLSYDQLKAGHLKDYASLFGRVRADFGASSSQQRQLPTDERREQAFSKTDPELENLLFQYGRYLMISCSRPGALPTNLQGLWNDTNDPAWHADYHTNINVEMNYWPVETTNLSETHLPFLELIRSQLPAWRKDTAASGDWKMPTGEPMTRGWALRVSHNPMGGMGWDWDKTANAWYCQHLWEHYAFGGDKKYLREFAYPIIKETVQFWRDHLKTLPDGRLVVPDGWSPEHGPHEDGVSYNQQIVWDLFTNYRRGRQSFETLIKITPRKLLAMRDNLVGPQIGRWGQLQEWMEDRDDPNDHHRHTSHLFAVFPGRSNQRRKNAGFGARRQSFARCARY